MADAINLQEELRMLINKHSRENESNTPDFILASYLMSCLEAFERASLKREGWYGKSLTIGGISIPGKNHKLTEVADKGEVVK